VRRKAFGENLVNKEVGTGIGGGTLDILYRTNPGTNVLIKSERIGQGLEKSGGPIPGENGPENGQRGGGKNRNMIRETGPKRNA